MPSPQNLKAMLKCGAADAAASSIENGSAEGRRENQPHHIERNFVPAIENALATTNAATTPVTGKMNKYRRSSHLRMT